MTIPNGTRPYAGAENISEGIAIIGMDGRFPGAEDIDAFWANLRRGKESITFFTPEELTASGISPADIADQAYVPAAGVLTGYDRFDAGFFGYSAMEAAVMDPQHRIFLESAWKAFENAGYDPAKAGRVGVYASGATSEYMLRNLLPNRKLMDSVGDYQIALSNFNDYVATRVSYKLDLKGPSINVNTACSSSLVALQMACQGLLDFHCDVALAGAVALRIPQANGYLHQDGHILSPDGHCRAFDEGARGTVPGSGVGVVVLKRLEDALARGDSIHAVILGTAVNNDGAGKIGFTAPSIEGQASAITDALAMAGVEPDSISYLEAHGTGTVLGDPMEIAALTRAYRLRTRKSGYCALGSVKTNIGHLDTAAGMAGLLKCVMSLKHGMLAPSLHYRKPNPKIDFASSPFYVNTELRPWDAHGRPRRAGVSSFGMGGTNTHAILEEFPNPRRAETGSDSETGRPAFLLPLSAKTRVSFRARFSDLASHLIADPGISLGDAAFTLACGRRHFPVRKAIACGDVREALAGLQAQQDAINSEGSSPVLSAPQPEPQIVFMFSGQGSQHVRMGLEAYRHEPLFRGQMDQCSELLKPLIGHSLSDILFPSPERAEAMEALIIQTSVAQPALFAMEYSLARLWMHWGLRPKAMIGHSIGEYVAACLAGVFTWEDGLRLVAERGRLMQAMPAGAMLFVPLEEEQALAMAGSSLDLAAVNGPAQCVLAGPLEAVADLEGRLTDDGVPFRRLRTSHAFHSRDMDNMLSDFRAAVGKTRRRPPDLPFVSNLTGTWITPIQAQDPEYWCAHLRGTVRFGRGMEAFTAFSKPVLIEVGPGQALTQLAKVCLEGRGHPVLPSCRKPVEGKSDLKVLYSALGAAWEHGAEVDWDAFHAPEKRRRLHLPSYRFDGKPYWIDAVEGNPESPSISRGSIPDARPGIGSWFAHPSWTRVPSRDLPAVTPVQSGSRPWLVVCEPGPLLDCMARKLRERNQDFISVVSGTGYEIRSPGLIAVNPEREGDWKALVNVAGAGKGGIGHVVHLWGAVSDAVNPGRGKTEALQSRGFFSLLSLGKSIASRPDFTGIRITVAACGIFDVTGEEDLCPEWAPLTGLCKVLPQEFPGMTLACLDTGRIPVEPRDHEALAAFILGEADVPRPEPMVAFRGAHRWLPFPKKIYLPGPTADGSRLKRDGVYLITGGLGRIGLVLAKKLVELVNAKIVFVGRTRLPPEAEWEGILASAQGRATPLGKQLETVLNLRQAGGRLLITHADVGDYAGMRAVVEAAIERFGRIDGVIHAAGLAREGLAESIGRHECQEEFRPKVGGLFVLEEVFRACPPDFFLLCSSLASVLGGLGFSAYAAANSFMDVFAADRNRNRGQDKGPAWISVNWDGWNFRDHATALGLGAGLKEYLMEPEEGAEAFIRILSSGLHGQVMVSTGDLEKRIGQWVTPDSPIKSPLLKGRPVLYPRPGLETPFQAASTVLEKSIAGVWEELLGVGPIGVNDDFFELGGHSLLATRLTSRLRESLQVNVPLRMLFNGPTISGLAKGVESLRWMMEAPQRIDGNTEPMEIGEI